MESRPDVLFDRVLPAPPRVTLILLDWSCRESFHIFDYLAKQDVPREWFEVLWIEYYDRAEPEIARRIEEAEARSSVAPVDRWIRLNMPCTAYYHKHLMYNVGVLASRGELVMIGDSDAMLTPRFVRVLCEAFEKDPGIVLHLDEVRNQSRRFHPFNYPTFDDVLADGCINWNAGKTTGLLETFDPLHTLNYGACICASKQDVIAVGGADEHVAYMGHICGPYDLTWRLKNSGRTEVWHQDEFLYHVWHPGSDGADNYLGPHDGRNLSRLALQTRRDGRVMPLVENAVIRRIRETGTLPASGLAELIRMAIGDRPWTEWGIDDLKRTISEGRRAWTERRYADAIALWEPIASQLSRDATFLSDLGWAYYFAGRYDDAHQAFTASISIEANNPDVHRGLGWTRALQGHHEEAVAEYTRAITLADPLDRLPLQEAYRGRAWSWFHLGSFDEAEEDFTFAMSITRSVDVGSLQDLYRGLGWVRCRQGRREEAVEQFARALVALGDRRGPEYDDAAAGLQQGSERVDSSPTPPAAVALPDPFPPTLSTVPSARTGVAVARTRLASVLRANLGWAYFKEHRYTEAAKAFKEALVLDCDNPPAACGLGWTSLHLGRLRDARAAFDRVISRTRVSDQTMQEALRGRAWVGYREGRSAGAIDDFGRALELADPERDVAVIRDIQRGRSRAYYLAGLKKRAVEELARIEGGTPLQLALRLRGSTVKNRISALLATARHRRIHEA